MLGDYKRSNQNRKAKITTAGTAGAFLLCSFLNLANPSVANANGGNVPEILQFNSSINYGVMISSGKTNKSLELEKFALASNDYVIVDVFARTSMGVDDVTRFSIYKISSTNKNQSFDSCINGEKMSSSFFAFPADELKNSNYIIKIESDNGKLSRTNNLNLLNTLTLEERASVMTELNQGEFYRKLGIDLSRDYGDETEQIKLDDFSANKELLDITSIPEQMNFLPGEKFYYQPVTKNNTNEELVYSILQGPEGLPIKFDRKTGTMEIEFNESCKGIYSLTLGVFSEYNLSVQNILLIVQPDRSR